MKTKHSSLIIFLLFAAIDANAVRKLMRIDRIEICDRSKNAPVFINDIRIVNPARENVRVSTNITLIRDIGTKLRLVAIVTRCANREALDNCIPFTTLRPRNTCSFIGMPNMAWTDIVNAFNPPFKCPFKKGEYIITNGTFDASLFNFFPIDNFYWKAKVIFHVLDEYVTVCADIGVYKSTI